MVEEEKFEEAKDFVKSGKILNEMLKKAQKLAKPGMKLLDLAEKLEKEIAEADKNAGIAFPVNLSLNHEAAHRTPAFNDEMLIGEKDVLKIDMGVHFKGAVTDAAFTIDFSGKHAKMVEAAQKALENALAIAKPGVRLDKIGTTIEQTLQGYGFKPVANLSGHGIGIWNVHIPPNVPNISKNDDRTIEDNFVFAIEPFATDGEGHVRESATVEIFQLDKARPLRNSDARQLIEYVAENYKTLPFAERHLRKAFPKMTELRFKMAMRELMRQQCFLNHPMLVEQPGRTVTQAETCVLFENGDVKVLVDSWKTI